MFPRKRTLHPALALARAALRLESGLSPQVPFPPLCHSSFHCRVNMAHTRQSRPDYGLGSQALVLKTPYGGP